MAKRKTEVKALTFEDGASIEAGISGRREINTRFENTQTRHDYVRLRSDSRDEKAPEPCMPYPY